MAGAVSVALDELLCKAQLSADVDFLREGVRTLAQAFMEAAVAQHLGAGRFERTPERIGERSASTLPIPLTGALASIPTTGYAPLVICCCGRNTAVC